MLDRARVAAAAVGALALAVPAVAAAQGDACALEWIPTFGARPGVDGRVLALEVFDDGRGPAVYLGGCFSLASNVPARNVARWDGVEYEALGSGVGGVFDDVCALAVYDDGTGPALYAGGGFGTAGGGPADRIARWDGTSWSEVGGGILGTVDTLAVYDDGSGPALFAGGRILSAGGVVTPSIARWDGASWSDVGGGITNNGTELPWVRSLAVHDDGTGEALYVGGRFLMAGSVVATQIARWDGTSWSAVGGGVTGGTSFPEVRGMAVFDDGTGPALHVAGRFSSVGGVPANHAAKWDGTAWSPLGSGISGVNTRVYTLEVLDDGQGGGPALYAGGAFSGAGGQLAWHAARWDGTAWSSLGAGTDDEVWAFAALGSGSSGRVYAGGEFDQADGRSTGGFARWDGAQWSPLHEGFDAGVLDVLTHDDGTGRALFVGGGFTSAGGAPLDRIGRWDGTSWSPLGGGMDDSVRALEVYDEGAGPRLFAAGRFTFADGNLARRIARWDGAGWTDVGGGVLGPGADEVAALTVFPGGGGPVLIAGGDFSQAGGVMVSNLARWNGSAWTSVGGGVEGGSFPDVRALASFDDGGGPALIVGGRFTQAGGTPVESIARWDGSSWSDLGGGISGGSFPRVESLLVHDDGGGPALYVGGVFTTVAGQAITGLARWDGTSWSAVGGGVGGGVTALAEFDDLTGGGPALYAGGLFLRAGGAPARRLARWDGAAWSPLGEGLSGEPAVLAAAVDGAFNARALYAGGGFASALDSGDSALAKWGCTTPPPPATYCTGKTNSAGCLAFVTTAGAPSASATAPFDVTARDVVPGQAGFLTYGFARANLAFHGGTLCVKAPLRRTANRAAQNTGSACSGWTLRRDFNRTIQAGADPALTAGRAVFAQWRQRDPADPAGFGDGLTDAVRFVVAP